MDHVKTKFHILNTLPTYFKTTFMCPRSITGVFSSQALPGYLITTLQLVPLKTSRCVREKIPTKLIRQTHTPPINVKRKLKCPPLDIERVSLLLFQSVGRTLRSSPRKRFHLWATTEQPGRLISFCPTYSESLLLPWQQWIKQLLRIFGPELIRIDWFWLRGWLIKKGAICTRTAPFLWIFISLFRNPRTRLVRKIGSKNQSVNESIKTARSEVIGFCGASREILKTLH